MCVVAVPNQSLFEHDLMVAAVRFGLDAHWPTSFTTPGFCSWVIKAKKVGNRNKNKSIRNTMSVPAHAFGIKVVKTTHSFVFDRKSVVLPEEFCSVREKKRGEVEIFSGPEKGRSEVKGDKKWY